MTHVSVIDLETELHGFDPNNYLKASLYEAGREINRRGLASHGGNAWNNVTVDVLTQRVGYLSELALQAVVAGYDKQTVSEVEEARRLLVGEVHKRDKSTRLTKTYFASNSNL